MKYRSTETELMDDFGMQGEELTEALDKIAWINRILGGNKITVNAVKTMARQQPGGEIIRIADFGCGNGDMLRAIADSSKEEPFSFEMTGIDANPFTVEHAEVLSEQYKGIRYHCEDILHPEFEPQACDIALLTLTLHHFTERQIVQLLTTIMQHTRIAIVINDLERSRLAYLLFGGLSRLFRLGKVNSNDGRLSILRGFKRAELEQLAQKLNLKEYSIRRKWAFRFRWIITGL